MKQGDPIKAIAREAIAREIEAEFSGVPNARRDSLRAADRIVRLIESGQEQ